MESEPLAILLDDLTKGHQQNNIYLVLDGNANVKDNQFRLMKKAGERLLSIFPSTANPPHPTTVTIMQADQAHTGCIGKSTNKTAYLSAIANVAQIKAGPDINASLQHIQTLGASAQGNKVVFIFSDGNVNAAATVNQMIQQKYHIFCFVITEAEPFDENPIKSIFGERVAIFNKEVDIEKWFDSLTFLSFERPEIFANFSTTTEISLKITPSKQDSEFEIHGYVPGAEDQPLQWKTTSTKISLRNLQPNKGYHLKVRGKKVNGVCSRFSEEIIVYTVSVSELSKTLKNIDELTEKVSSLRKKYRNYKIPASLSRSGLKVFNIILFGPIGNGKSSLVNTILTALLNGDQHPCQVAATGENVQSFTRNLAKSLIFGGIPIKIWDIFGWQNDKAYAELQLIRKGRLMEGFEEGSIQDETNRFLKAESDINNVPHAYIHVCDIWTASSPTGPKKVREFNNLFKQGNADQKGAPTFIAMTKLEEHKDKENEPLPRSDINQVLDYSPVQDMIQKFAQETGMSRNDIFLILNYQGVNDERSLVRDYLALNLLDKVVMSIETSFRRYKIVNIVDQENEQQIVIRVQSLDIKLEDFAKYYFMEITSKKFKPIGFYNRDEELVDEDSYKKVSLENIVYNATLDSDNFENYTLKLDNHRVLPPKSQDKKAKTVYISYHKSFDENDREIKCMKETLKDLREELELTSRMVFSEVEESKEATMLVINAVDSENKLYVVPKPTPVPAQSARISIKCKDCPFGVSGILTGPTVSDVRQEIDTRSEKHQVQSYGILTTDGLPLARCDENEVRMGEIIVEDDIGNKQIIISCDNNV